MSCLVLAQVWNLGPVAQIPLGEGKAYDLGRLQVAVFRSRNGVVYATQAGCPHKQGPLADGILGGEQIVCPLHGYAFDLKTGAPVGHACGTLKTHPVRISPEGNLLLETGG